MGPQHPLVISHINQDSYKGRGVALPLGLAGQPPAHPAATQRQQGHICSCSSRNTIVCPMPVHTNQLRRWGGWQGNLAIRWCCPLPHISVLLLRLLSSEVRLQNGNSHAQRLFYICMKNGYYIAKLTKKYSKMFSPLWQEQQQYLLAGYSRRIYNVH